MNGKRDKRGKEKRKGFGVGTGFRAGKKWKGKGRKMWMHVNYVRAMKWNKRIGPKNWMTTIISQADTWVNTDGHNNEMHNLRSSVLLIQRNNRITQSGRWAVIVNTSYKVSSLFLFFQFLWYGGWFPWVSAVIASPKHKSELYSKHFIFAIGNSTLHHNWGQSHRVTGPKLTQSLSVNLFKLLNLYFRLQFA